MEFSFSYDKKKVIHALRLHFISRKEIKWMVILVNVFAIISAILFYTRKIRPEPFVLGTFVWIVLMLSVWYILPHTIYKKSETFKGKFIIYYYEEGIKLDNGIGYVNWNWKRFSGYFESAAFFHLYFSDKAFFLIPKNGMNTEQEEDIRVLLSTHIEKWII